MSSDFVNYEHKPGATTTLVSDPNTGLPVEVDVDEFGAAKMPDLIPTYRPSAEEIEAAKKPVAGTGGSPAGAPTLTVPQILGILSAPQIQATKTDVSGVSVPPNSAGTIAFAPASASSGAIGVPAIRSLIGAPQAAGMKTNVVAINIPVDPNTVTIEFVLT